MNEDDLNMEIRRFLKKVGITSQRNIEQAIHQALAEGQLKGDEALSVSMTLEVNDLQIKDKIEGTIQLS